MEQNIFLKEITVFTGMEEVDKAWKEGGTFYKAALRGDYKQVPQEQFFAIFKNNLRKTNEYGLLDLCPNIPTDRETRVGIMYQPSYAIIAAGVYFRNTYKEGFDQEVEQLLSNLMSAAFEYGIVGHGFDRNAMVRRTMLMMCLAGAREFVTREPEFNKAFTESMLTNIEVFESIVAHESSGKKVYDSGFETLPANYKIHKVVAAWKGDVYPIFVYGTLLSGERASNMLKDSHYCGKFVLKDYGMYDMGDYPAIFPCANETVVGEVYFVSEKTRRQLDYYEGEGSLYYRRQVTVSGYFGEICVDTYVYHERIHRNVFRAPWNVTEDSVIWYATYGSNLSADRFRCYIEGKGHEKVMMVHTGCRNKTIWKESECTIMPGKIYFGNVSGSWGRSGVAFYDAKAEGQTYMRLYKITWGQLQDIQKQEGDSPRWYGMRICLGVNKDGCPIYTITSEAKNQQNPPHKDYVDLIYTALVNECGYSEKDVKKYMESIR